MARNYPDNLPGHYASDKLSMMRGWWNGEIGRLIRQFTPSVFPGAPPEVLLGFASNSNGPGENTTGWLTGLPAEREEAARVGHRPLSGTFDGFHETGLFGVESGEASGPAPGQQPGPHNNWLPTATSQDVRNLLHRAATMEPGGWVSLPDQIAVGMVNTRNAGRTVMASLPANIRSSSEGSLWFVALAFMGWSAGTGGAAAHVRRYADRLSTVPEKSRWGAFNYWLAQDITRGIVSPRPVNDHGNPAYSAIRNLQKIVAGQRLAEDLGRSTLWFEDCVNVVSRAVVHDVLARGAVGQASRAVVIPPSSLDCKSFWQKPGWWLGFGAGAVVVVTAGVVVVRSIKTESREPEAGK